MRYLVVEEFPEGQFNIVDTFNYLIDAITQRNKLQGGYVFPLNKKEITYDKEELLFVLKSVFQAASNHFDYSLEEYFNSRNKECSVSRHLIRYEFMQRFNITNRQQYRRLEEEVSGKTINHTTIMNSVEHAHTARVHPDPLHKTVYLILESYL